MSKKDIAKAIPTYKKPVEDVFSEFTEPTPAAPEQSERKTERISVIVTPEIAKDFHDLLAARIVTNQLVEGGIMGKKPKRYSANLLATEALTWYLSQPEIQAELKAHREKFNG